MPFAYREVDHQSSFGLRRTTFMDFKSIGYRLSICFGTVNLYLFSVTVFRGKIRRNYVCNRFWVMVRQIHMIINFILLLYLRQTLTLQ
jgi:hypothetical protein